MQIDPVIKAVATFVSDLWSNVSCDDWGLIDRSKITGKNQLNKKITQIKLWFVFTNHN